MRKIPKESIKAFYNREPFKKSNMTVAEVRDDVLKKYKEMNDYVNNLIVGKKISIIKLIEFITSSSSGVGNEVKLTFTNMEISL